MRRTVTTLSTLYLAVLMLAIIGLQGEAQAKKVNVVQCPTTPDTRYCVGTAGDDHLIGGPASRPEGEFDRIEGGEGDDLYRSGGGGDVLVDHSATSDDTYWFPSTEFSKNPWGFNNYTSLNEWGGNTDVLDLRAYRSTDFAFSARFSDYYLGLDGPGDRDLHVFGFYQRNTIDLFKFSDRTLTAKQIKKEYPPTT